MKMRREFAGAVLFLAVLLWGAGPVYPQEAKGLAPGWFSLDGSVGLLDKKIEEGKASLEKALGINISGFLDASYTWSSNNPGNRTGGSISGRYFDQDHNQVVFNHFNLTLEKPEKDWGVGFKLVADFGRSAELLREATLWGGSLKPEPSAELREAFITTTLPVGAGLQVKGGLFVTTLGTEIIPNPGAYNDNISRSFLFNFAIPFRHLGVLFTYPLHKMVSISAGPVTGWDNPHDNNGQPSFLGGVTLTPTDTFSLATNLIVGPEQKHNSGHKRIAVSNVATIKPMDPLTLFLEYTYGNEGGNWQGFATIASYNWTDRFTTALRGEVFRDNTATRLGQKATLGEVTLTGAYKFTAKLLGRAEVRQDWSNAGFFVKGNSGEDKSQTTLALQLIYTY